MALRGAILGVAAPGTNSSEKRRAKAKRDKGKPKLQNPRAETVCESRERCSLPSLPSLHLRISFADFSKRGFGRWSLPRRPGNDNVQVVRTKSQAGMHRPLRFPTIYKSNSRLFIDPLETLDPKDPKSEPNTADYSDKHSVIVDLPERVEMHIASLSTEKHSVVVGIPNALEITLSPRRERGLQPSSRIVELNDDASVHELEAVYPTASTAEDHLSTPTTVVLCEADDPTALPTLDLRQPSFSVRVKQRRPKISLRIPRSKSLHVVSENTASGSAVMIGPPSPTSSNALCRSLTQTPPVRYSIISPLTSIDMPQPMRPYSTISVPLFMEASDLAHTTDETHPPPYCAEEVAENYQTPREEKQPCSGVNCPDTSMTRRDIALTSSPSPSEEADTEEDGEPAIGMARSSMIKNTMAGSINKPLPPEPRVEIPSTLPTSAYKPRQIRAAQSQEILPRSRYSPTRAGKFHDFRKLAGGKTPSLDQAIEELEWRLSSMCERHAGLHGSRQKTPVQVSRGLTLMQPSRALPPITQRADGESVQRPRRRIVRSNSANHIILQSRCPYERRTRSCQDLQKWSRGALELPMVEESETWYKTASERSSTDLSHSVFSDTGTDGTSQTEQSNTQEKGKEKDKVEAEKENEHMIINAALPRAMQSLSLPADVAETVILRIMSSLTTLGDLFAAAALNKGFYKTFKQHEMYLIKCTLFKSSAAAWELREITEECRVTPTAYLRQHSVEMYTMGMLKSLILVQCESFLRPATIAGLVGTDQIRSAEIDAAFWRVWTFCRRFGSTAGEDEDIEEQIDWLNGGQLARQQDSRTCFGLGNGSGLSKSELYDMIELWTCLSVLVQTFHGRVKEARAAGIYSSCKVDASRDEEALLEEWTWYLLTLGPSCILALAPGSFSTAKDLSMTQWTPPAPGPGSSRSKFFKEALTRAYEERLDEETRANGGKAKRASRSSHRLTRSEIAWALDRARQAAFAEEMKVRRMQSPSRSEPWTFSDERPMSAYSQVVKSLPHVASQISAQDLAAMPKPPTQYTAPRVNSRKSSKRRSGYRSPERPQTPVVTSSSAVPLPGDDLPVSSTGIEAAVPPLITISEAANEKPAIVDPTDRAMTHLVDVLGFGKAHAKWALTRSENGHGIDMEKAIDMLVTGSSQSSRASSREYLHSPIEVDSSPAKPSPKRRRTPAMLPQRDSIFAGDGMTDVELDQERRKRSKEKCYRILGIGTPSPGGRFGSAVGKRFTRR